MLICIDYLIINLSGISDFSNKDNFTIENLSKKTKVFQNILKVSYKNKLLGQLLSDPYENSVIAKDFKQFQFDNSAFYTYDLKELREIVFKFLLAYKYDLEGINRLDIAIDSDTEKEMFYSNLVNNITQRNILIAGRKKHFVPYYESNNGKINLTGFTIGKRSNSRFFRCYNKSLNLLETPKEYISDWHKKNGLSGTIWRKEYQLNNVFLKQLQNEMNDTKENIFWSIFDNNNLLQIFEEAAKNHLEFKTNTNKTEVNKEQTIKVFDFKQVKNIIEKAKINIVKIKKTIENKVLGIKRTIKSLFSEYYITNQSEYEFPITIYNLIKKYNLFQWFDKKKNDYIIDLREKQKINYQFDFNLLNEHFQLCI